MRFLRSFFLPSFDTADVLDNARRRLVHVMCLVSAVIAAGYVAPEVTYSIRHGYTYIGTWFYMALPPAFVALSFVVKRPSGLKLAASLLLSGAFIATLLMRFDTGFFVPGSVFFATLPMLAGMLLGWRGGVIMAVAVIATYAGLYTFRDLAPPTRVLDAAEYDLQAFVNFSVLSASSAMCALLFMFVMERVIAQLRATNDELKTYKQNLETLVDQRTETILQQKEELERALKLAEDSAVLQNQLVSVVSHEIRTPLAIIDGAARRIGKRAGQMSAQDLTERTDVIRNSVQRLTHLMERTLDAARLADGSIRMECKALSLPDVIHQVVSREQELHPDFQFDIALDADVDQVMGDQPMLDHLFSNLVSNAIKYSGENKIVEIGSKPSCQFVEIFVRDHGIGIPAGELSHVSERLFRASTAAGIPGTGIGLNLCKQIVAKHDGEMRFESEVGIGTTVTVRLPIKSCAASHLCGGDLVCSSTQMSERLKTALG